MDIKTGAMIAGSAVLGVIVIGGATYYVVQWATPGMVKRALNTDSVKKFIEDNTKNLNDYAASLSETKGKADTAIAALNDLTKRVEAIANGYDSSSKEFKSAVDLMREIGIKLETATNSNSEAMKNASNGNSEAMMRAAKESTDRLERAAKEAFDRMEKMVESLAKANRNNNNK